MRNSVSHPALDPHGVLGITEGALDAFDYVDALPDLMPHPRPHRVPAGAPLIVGGWAADPNGQPARAVAVVLDGARQYSADSGLSRLDVAAAHPGTAERVGFQAIVPTSDLSPGAHELRAYAVLDDGAWYEAAYQPFWITATPLRGLPVNPRRLWIHIDQVIDLSTGGALVGFDAPIPLGHFALVTGWAADPSTRRGVAGAAAIDRKGNVWAAPCDVPRPDLRGPTNSDDDRLGFEIIVPTDALGRGRHQLEIVGFGADGRLFGGGTKVPIDVAGPPRPFPAFAAARRAPARAEAAVVVLEAGQPTPAVHAGPRYAASLARGTVALVEGWALESNGNGASCVFLEFTSDRAGVPPHRFPAIAGFRRDQKQPAVPAPPVDDGWFSAQFDTAHLTPGRYALALAVVDASRRAYARRELGSVTVLAASDSAARRT